MFRERLSKVGLVPRIGTLIRKARIRLLNMLRQRRHVPRYLLMTLSGEINEIPPPRLQVPFSRFFLPPEPVSVSSLRRQLEQIALDPRVDGLVLKIECVCSGATYQSLRQLFLDFRAKGKRLIAYANSFGPFQYYLACACDQIIMPPSAEWSVVGMFREYLFFKDALDQLGIGVDVINVSPYKSAFDQFVRTDFSAESRAQAEWMLDAQFEELVRGIGVGRKLNETQVRSLIDSAPLGAREAVERGLLDAALYEDELETYLAPEPALPQSKSNDKKESAQRVRQLDLYEDAWNALLIPYVEYASRLIGVVRIEGTIVEGRSQSLPLPIPLPFFGNRLAGSESVVQALRRAAADDRIAAVILYVDSPGGSALASDLIAREMRRLRSRKPVVAYMSGVAASGGYYVSTLAQQIIAQPLTITGSIGVIAMKPNVQGAEKKLYLHRTVLQRGERAGISSAATPLNAPEYEALAAMIQRAYDDFKRLVAEGRKLSVDSLEPIAGGRVWTGEMARQRGLVDTLGDFTVAVDRARALAGLPEEKRVRAIAVGAPRKFVLPAPQAATAIGATLLGIAGTHLLWRWLTRVQTWALLPWQMTKSD